MTVQTEPSRPHRVHWTALASVILGVALGAGATVLGTAHGWPLLAVLPVAVVLLLGAVVGAVAIGDWSTRRRAANNRCTCGQRGPTDHLVLARTDSAR